MNPYSPHLSDRSHCESAVLSQGTVPQGTVPQGTVSILSLIAGVIAAVTLPFWSYCIAAYINHHFPQNMGTWAMFQTVLTLGSIPFSAGFAWRISHFALNMRLAGAICTLGLTLCSLAPLTFLIVYYFWAHGFANFIGLTAVSGVFIFLVPAILGATMATMSGAFLMHRSPKNCG